MLTPNGLISAVAAKVRTVPNIGIVHEYRRKVQTESDAFAMWVPVGGTKINAWQVSIAEPAVNTVRHPGFGAIGSGQSGTVLSDIGISIEAVASIDDDAQSEVTFRDLVWSVVMGFNTVGKLNSDVTQQGPMQWERFGYLVLAQMYHLHYARLRCSFIGQVAP